MLLERERAARVDAEAANLAKDEFLAMLSHELRNPLAAIGNASQVLVDLETKHAFGGRAVEIIHRQTKHLARLVDDLLDVGRVTAGKIVLARQRVNWPTGWRKLGGVFVVGRCRTTAPKSSWRRCGGMAMLIAKPDHRQSAYQRDEVQPMGGLIRVQTLQEGDQAILRVTASGIGIAPDLLPRVLISSLRSSAAWTGAGGIGVGLTLVRRLVELHGGRVDAHSHGISKGQHFVVRRRAPSHVKRRAVA